MPADHASPAFPDQTDDSAADARIASQRVLIIAGPLGSGGMTRHIAEYAQAVRDAGGGCAILTPAGGGLEAHAQRLSGAGVALFRPVRVARSSLRAAVRAVEPDFTRLCTGAFPPDTRISLRMLGVGVPVIESLHVLPRRLRVKPMQRLFHALRPKRRYRLLVLSDAMLREVRERLPRLAPYAQRIDNGVRLPERDISIAPPDPPLPVRFITACRLDESHKDVATLLRAFALLCERNIDAALTILGDGPDRAHLESLAAALNLGERARFAGWADDVARELARAHAAVLSTKREGLPRFAIEAQALGLPVVITDAPGCAEALSPGETGLLVPPGDAQALADALAKLATDQPLRRRLAAAAPAFAQRFDICRYTRRVAAIADEMLRRA